MKTAKKPQTIGDRIRAARDAKGWTHEELARRAGISLDSTIKIQGGKRQPEAETLRKLCVALGVSADVLLGLR